MIPMGVCRPELVRKTPKRKPAKRGKQRIVSYLLLGYYADYVKEPAREGGRLEYSGILTFYKLKVKYIGLKIEVFLQKIKGDIE